MCSVPSNILLGRICENTSLEFPVFGKSTAQGELLDVTLACGEHEEVWAHQVLLAAVSTFRDTQNY